MGQNAHQVLFLNAAGCEKYVCTPYQHKLLAVRHL